MLLIISHHMQEHMVLHACFQWWLYFLKGLVEGSVNLRFLWLMNFLISNQGDKINIGCGWFMSSFETHDFFHTVLICSSFLSILTFFLYTCTWKSTCVHFPSIPALWVSDGHGVFLWNVELCPFEILHLACHAKHTYAILWRILAFWSKIVCSSFHMVSTFIWLNWNFNYLLSSMESLVCLPYTFCMHELLGTHVHADIQLLENVIQSQESVIGCFISWREYSLQPVSWKTSRITIEWMPFWGS